MSNPGAPNPARAAAGGAPFQRHAAPEPAIVAALGARSVVLVGMMGAGKSSIGRRLATRLGIPFVDADTEIEKAAGMSIPDIFATRGEPDFRAGEARVIARLLDGGPQVLATGGGAFMNADTRAAIGAKGVSIWLKADFETLMRRIKRRHDRPLLHTDDPAATLQQLIDARYPIYALADFTVQSREVPHDKIVDEIVAVLGAGPLPRSAAGRSDARETSRHDRAVAKQRSDRRRRRARRAQLRHRDRPRPARLARRAHREAAPGRQGRDRQRRERRARSISMPRWRRSKAPPAQVSTVVLPPGESTKSFAHLASLCDDLISQRIERSDLVVALGGGVIGDLAGFAAAIVRRGLDYVQVPTSLLAQVDSSVGGKTAIDSPQGKNLIGAFHQPVLVIADTALLDTLPEREFRAGYAEVAKYGLLGDAAFFAWLEANWKDVFAGGPAREHAIATSCRAKAAIVARDERETGDRMLLNLGHTFGHALEADAGFSDRLLHGEAIAIGMALAFEFSARRGLLPMAEAERAIGHLAAVGLPTQISEVPGGTPGIDRLMDADRARTRRSTRGKLTFILARGDRERLRRAGR